MKSLRSKKGQCAANYYCSPVFNAFSSDILCPSGSAAVSGSTSVCTISDFIVLCLSIYH